MGKIERDGITYVYADGTGGLQSIPDILQNIGTLHLIIDPPPEGDIDGQCVMTGLYSNHFVFEININRGRFNFIRNGVLASQILPRGTRKSVHFVARWDPESIDVTVLEDGYGGLSATEKPPIESFQSKTATPYTVVPDELIQWAHKQNHLPTISLASADKFFVEFVNIINHMQETIRETGCQRIFWDFKQGNGKPPTPKAEPQVTDAIHLLLKDAAVRKDFQIVPQAGAAGGNLDFQINKVVEGGKLAVLAMEAKHAHAQDVKHGLFTQLPAYMRAVSADFGVYLVLWFRGNVSNQPTKTDFTQLQLKFDRERPRPPGNVRVMHLDLSIPAPPSKR